jgi:hypothetical protein
MGAGAWGVSKTAPGPADSESPVLVVVDYSEEAEAPAERLGIDRDVLLTHEELHPPDDGTALHPLRPDRLGEDFLAEHLRRHRRAEGLLRRVVAAAEPAALRRALTILAAAARGRRPVRRAATRAGGDHRRADRAGRQR